VFIEYNVKMWAMWCIYWQNVHDVTNDDLKKSTLFYGEIIEIRNEITNNIETKIDSAIR